MIMKSSPRNPNIALSNIGFKHMPSTNEMDGQICNHQTPSRTSKYPAVGCFERLAQT